jgi:hypothetical protein
MRSEDAAAAGRVDDGRDSGVDEDSDMVDDVVVGVI